MTGGGRTVNLSTEAEGRGETKQFRNNDNATEGGGKGAKINGRKKNQQQQQNTAWLGDLQQKIWGGLILGLSGWGLTGD